MASRIPILTFHSIDDSGSVISISPSRFHWQMEYLRSNGWRALTLDEFLTSYSRGTSSPKTFLLTFDDGFKNLAAHALPVLASCGFTATIFVVTDWVGQTNDWQGQWSGIARAPLLDWNELRTFANAGVEIGGHSVSHPYLPRLDIQDATREIVESKRVIEEQIGCSVKSFAYPYGATSREVEKIVAQNYHAGFGTWLGFASAASRVIAFERIDAFYLRDPFFFKALAQGWLSIYLQARQLIRDVRHSMAR